MYAYLYSNQSINHRLKETNADASNLASKTSCSVSPLEDRCIIDAKPGIRER